MIQQIGLVLVFSLDDGSVLFLSVVSHGGSQGSIFFIHHDVDQFSMQVLVLVAGLVGFLGAVWPSFL